MADKRCPLCDGANVDSWGCRDCFERRTAFTPRTIPPAPVSPGVRLRKCAECGTQNIESDFVDRKGKTRTWCSRCRKRWAARKAKADATTSKRKGRKRKERRPASEPRRKPPPISAAAREQERERRQREMAEAEAERERLRVEREEREAEHAELSRRRQGQRLLGQSAPTPAQLRLAELNRRLAEEQRQAYGYDI